MPYPTTLPRASYVYYHHVMELGRWHRILQTSSSELTERTRAIAELSRFVLNHEKELYPQDKETVLECLSCIRSSDSSASCGELVLTLLRSEHWELWEANQCFNALENLGMLAMSNNLDTLTTEHQRILQGSVNNLVRRLISLDLNEVQCSTILWKLGELAYKNYLSNLTPEHQELLQGSVINLVRRLSNLNPDAIDCNESLWGLGVLSCTDCLGNLKRDRRNILQKGVCALAYTLNRKNPSLKQCSDALERLGYLAQGGWFTHLSEGDQGLSLSLLQKTLFELMHKLKARDLSATQCAHILWGLGWLSKAEILKERQSRDESPLQDYILTWAINCNNGVLDPLDCSDAFLGIGRLVCDGHLKRLSREALHAFQDIICSLVVGTKRTNENENPFEHIWCLGVFAQRGFFKNLRGNQLEVLQRIICELTNKLNRSAPNKDQTNVNQYSEALQGLAGLAEEDLFDGVSEEQLKILQGSMINLACNLACKLSQSSDDEVQCANALWGLGVLTRRGLSVGLSEEQRKALQESAIGFTHQLGTFESNEIRCGDALCKLVNLVDTGLFDNLLKDQKRPLQGNVVRLAHKLDTLNPNSDQCSDALNMLIYLVGAGFLDDLLTNQRKSFQGSAVRLAYKLNTSNPNPNQCSEALNALGHFAKYDYFEGLSEDHQNLLQEAVLGLTHRLHPRTINSGALIGLGCLSRKGFFEHLGEKQRFSVLEDVLNSIHRHNNNELFMTRVLCEDHAHTLITQFGWRSEDLPTSLIHKLSWDENRFAEEYRDLILVDGDIPEGDCPTCLSPLLGEGCRVVAHRSSGSQGQEVLHMFHLTCLYNAVRFSSPTCPLCAKRLVRTSDERDRTTQS